MDKQAQAEEFFEQLTTFSDRYVQAELKLPTATSPWGKIRQTNQELKGPVIHYTADNDLLRVLRWFCVEKYESKVSSHVVVSDRKLSSTSKLMQDLPLVQELPVTVVQTRPTITTAYHATWTNSEFYGIENLNAGELKEASDGSEGFVSWRPRDLSAPKWTMPWSNPLKTPTALYGRYWEPYTMPQIATNVVILRYLRDLFGTLREGMILGHEQVQGVDTRKLNGEPMDRQKRDPGPHYPLMGVREATFGHGPVDGYPWYLLCMTDPMYGQTWRDGDVIRVVRNLSKIEPGQPDTDPETAWARFKSGYSAMKGSNDRFGSWGKLAMRLLGYHTNFGPLAIDPETVKTFQKLSGLKVDGMPGKITRAAIWDRLQERGIVE